MNRIYSALGILAVIAIGAVFIINFRPLAGQGMSSKGPDCAATIHGACVPGSHFNATLRLLSSRMRNDAQFRAQRIRESTMNGLVERQLLLEDAKRLGIGVSDDDITAALRAGFVHISFPGDRIQGAMQALGLSPAGTLYLPFTNKDGKLSPDTYRKFVNDQTNLSEIEFREYQRQETIAARVRDLIRSRAEISESEVKDTYIRRKTTAQVKYVKIARKYFADNVLDTSDAAIDAWAGGKDNKDQVEKVFQSRKADYVECRNAKHILVRVD